MLVAEPLAPREFTLRPYQHACLAAVEAGWKEFSRLLVDMPTGSGKTTVFAALAKLNHEMGGKTLVLANRDRLVRQTADRIQKETGIDAEIEMADERASPYAPIVVASVQTLANHTRLTSFPDDHFSLIVPDEAHHSGAPTWAKVLNYFNIGAESLAEDWEHPVPGVPFKHKAKVCGVTATPDLGARKSLGEWYQSLAFRYTLIEAVNDGWLVPIIMENVPLEIDVRGLKAGRTNHGSDFTDADISARLVPVIEALAKQICAKASNRKSIAFVPSVECARLLAEAINRHGLRGIFVSGSCEDVDEKTDAFRDAGPGTVLCNCALYVEGADFPDVSCVIFGRVTRSKGFFRQMAGRGTRVLPGIVDGLETAELRKLAIANSKKPNLLLLDPLWLSDEIDLCSAYDLFTDKPEVKQRMAAMGGVGKDLVELEKDAERDFLAALTREARKKARRDARVIDPLALCVTLGEESLVMWEPTTQWEELPPTPGQLNFLRKQHIDVEKIKYRGLAQAVTVKLLQRFAAKLCSYEQMTFLAQLEVPEKDTVMLTRAQATALIDAKLAEKKAAESVKRVLRDELNLD